MGSRAVFQKPTALEVLSNPKSSWGSPHLSACSCLRWRLLRAFCHCCQPALRKLRVGQGQRQLPVCKALCPEEERDAYEAAGRRCSQIWPSPSHYMPQHACGDATPLHSFPHPGYRFEDGTIPFLDVIALKHGFDALERLTGRGTLLSRGICSHSPHPLGSPAGVTQMKEWVCDRLVASGRCTETAFRASAKELLSDS